MIIHMRKLVLLAINAKYVHSSLSVWVLRAGVEKFARTPHEVEVIEATIHQNNDEITDLIAAHSPDVVGISTYIWNAAKLPELLKALRERLPGAALVLGGPEAGCNPEYWLPRGADHVLCGEGERTLPALLDSLSRGVTAETEPLPLLEPVDPYSEAYFSALNGRIAYLETSRGCPFQCAFCLSGGRSPSVGGSVRFFPLDTAKTWIYRLAQSGARTIKFVDRTFNCNSGRAYDLFEFVIGLDTDRCFHFEVAADLFDERTLSLLSKAPPGRIQLEAGLQSFYEPALRASSRQTDLEKVERNIRTLLWEQNIHIHVDLIAGLPYETLSDFQAGFDRAYALGAHTLQLGFLKLLHGSRLRQQAYALGLCCSAEPPYEIKRSPWLSAEDLIILKQTENALQHTYNKGRFLSVLEYLLRVSGLRPFTLFHALGKSAPNHGTPLDVYAGQIFDCFTAIPGVDVNELRERMVCDWLSMVGGKNMPPLLKIQDRRRLEPEAAAQKLLGHGIRRHEAAVLPSGRGVFADTAARSPVTGLYRLYFVEL